jgi:hypothetical protein
MDARQTIQRIGRMILIVVGTVAAADSLAANVTVRCGGAGEDAFPSITAALAHLEARGPNVVTVHGACQENLSIVYFNRLTLNAAAGASISDASGGVNSVIAITDSQTVVFNGFTINGAVVCQIASTCGFSGNTFQNSPRDGIQLQSHSYALFNGDQIVNSTGRGLLIAGGSIVDATAITVTGNGLTSASAGIRLVQSAVLLLNASTIANNGLDGIRVTDHSSLHTTDNTVTGNFDSGIGIESGSEARFSTGVTGNVISGNGNYGVFIADLSLGNNETAGNTISGNHTRINSGQRDVQCVGKSPAAVGQALKAGTVSATCGP